MDLSEIQNKTEEFIISRKWNRFDSTLVFAHLIEELGEIASYLLYKNGYKVEGAGHKKNIDKKELSAEFAQAFNLFLQLAIQSDVDIEDAWMKEHEKNKNRFEVQQWEDLAKKAQSEEN